MKKQTILTTFFFFNNNPCFFNRWATNGVNKSGLSQCASLKIKLTTSATKNVTKNPRTIQYK